MGVLDLIQPPSSGSGVPTSTYAAKGDLVAASAAATIDHLSIGSDGQILIADSSQPLGLRWGTNTATSETGLYNVKTQYGAVGDGVANDRTAIQNAIDAASTAGGGVVYLPAGTYKLTSALTPKSNVSIRGAGMFMSTLAPSGASIFSALTNLTFTSGAPGVNMVFSDFAIDGSGISGTYGSGMKGIYMTYLARCHFRNLYIHDTGASGLGIDFLVDTHIVNNLVKNCGRLNTGSSPGGAGIGIGTNGFANESCTVIGNTVTGCGTYGIFFESQGGSATNGANFKIVGNHVDGNKYGIGLSGGIAAIVNSNTIFNNTSHGISVDNGTLTNGRPTYLCQISNNYLRSNAGAGISLNYKGTQNSTNSRMFIASNYFSSNTLQGIVAQFDANNISNVAIIDNYMFDSKYAGISFEYSGTTNTGTITSAIVRGNTVIASGGTAVSNETAAIQFRVPATNCVVENNSCYDTQTTKTQTYGLNISQTFTGGSVANNDFRNNLTGTINGSSNLSATTVLRNNAGFTPPVPAAVTVTASPMTYTASTVGEWLFINGGTVSSVTLGGVTVASTTDVAIPCEPSDSVVITYSSAPTLASRRR